MCLDLLLFDAEKCPLPKAAPRRDHGIRSTEELHHCAPAETLDGQPSYRDLIARWCDILSGQRTPTELWCFPLADFDTRSAAKGLAALPWSSKETQIFNGRAGSPLPAAAHETPKEKSMQYSLAKGWDANARLAGFGAGCYGFDVLSLSRRMSG